MQSRHMNEKFGATYPTATGDRYWAVDMIRDRRFFEENAGLLLQIMNKNFSDNIILSGLWCSQGAGHTMNVVAGKSLVKFSVTVTHRTSAWTIPAATEAIDIMKIVEYAGGTNLSLSGIDTGGVNSNYVKLKFIETDGNTRARAKASGTYAYETYPDAVITFGATAPTAYETVLAEFTSNGATLTFVNNGNRQYMGKGQEDVTIYTQADFAAIIERTAANSYRFKQGLTSIYLKALSTGYPIPLSGGDTWGALLTNYCTRLVAEGGAFLNVGDTASYFAANTDGCVVDGLYIKGTGSVAAACSYGITIGAENVTLRNCKVSNRYTNVDFAAFDGGNYKASNIQGCKVYSINCSTAGKYVRAFYRCYNVVAPYISGLTSSAGVVKFIDQCDTSILWNESEDQFYINKNINDVKSYAKNDSGVLIKSGDGGIDRVFDIKKPITAYFSPTGTASLYVYQNGSWRLITTTSSIVYNLHLNPGAFKIPSGSVADLYCTGVFGATEILASEIVS